MNNSPPFPAHNQQVLAVLRAHMANERKLVTYVTSSLVFIGFGLFLLQVYPSQSDKLGYTALATAVVVMTVGLSRFRTHYHRIEADFPSI